MTRFFRLLVPSRLGWGMWAILAGTVIPAVTVAQVAPPAPASVVAAPAPPPPTDSAALRRRRLRGLVGGSAVGYGVLYTGLAMAWYTGERAPLRWFNDWPEWKQLDKAGHFWGAFQESRGAVAEAP